VAEPEYYRTEEDSRSSSSNSSNNNNFETGTARATTMSACDGGVDGVDDDPRRHYEPEETGILLQYYSVEVRISKRHKKRNGTRINPEQ